jgi:hypothetical protein
MGLRSSGDREGRAMARRKSELLIGNGATGGDCHFCKKAAGQGEDSKGAMVFQVIFLRSFQV